MDPKNCTCGGSRKEIQHNHQQTRYKSSDKCNHILIRNYHLLSQILLLFLSVVTCISYTAFINGRTKHLYVRFHSEKFRYCYISTCCIRCSGCKTTKPRYDITDILMHACTYTRIHSRYYSVKLMFKI